MERMIEEVIPTVRRELALDVAAEPAGAQAG
jgi:hypothetical protein